MSERFATAEPPDEPASGPGVQRRPPATSAIVLAGGQARRFGRDKLAAVIDGQPLLHHAVRAAAAVADEVVLVVGAGAPVPDLPGDLAEPVRVTHDARPGVGPLAGLAAGLAEVRAPVAIVVGGDMPILRPAVLAALVARVAGPAGRQAAILNGGEGITQPLPAAIAVAVARPVVDDLLASGERSLRAALAALRTDALALHEWRALDPDRATPRDVDERAAIDTDSSGDARPAPPRPAGFWSMAWPAWYRLLRLAGPAIVALTRRTGYGNLVVLRVRGRRTGRERIVPLGLLTVGGRRYLGHPNGDTAWTMNLEAAGTAVLERPGEPEAGVRPVRLGPGPERKAVVRASFRQHPFPGNALYRLAGAHVQAHGTFFRLEPEDGRRLAPDPRD